ncbi:hypothetical protein DID99_28355 [Burkholderia sp. Bp8986]|nr:hypothetical protein DID99_28355 [Burkholderia sp. Bp8986]
MRGENSHVRFLGAAAQRVVAIRQLLCIMSSKQLPELTSPSLGELRDLWRRYPEGHDVRALIVEISRARKNVAEAEVYRRIVQKVWNEESGGSTSWRYTRCCGC